MSGFAVFDRTPPQADGPNNWSNDRPNNWSNDRPNYWSNDRPINWSNDGPRDRLAAGRPQTPACSAI